MSRVRFNLAHDLHNMSLAPVASTVIQTIYKSSNGILSCYGTSAVSVLNAEAADTYAPGCLYQRVNGASSIVYINEAAAGAVSSFQELTGTAAAVTGIQENYQATVAGGVGPSPLIWDDAPLFEVMLDPSKGFYYFNEYDQYAGMALAATASSHDLTYTERTDGLCTNMPTLPGGIVQLDSVATTADQGGTFQHVGIQIEPAAGTVIRMEWRAAIDADNGQCFMGLCDDSITAPVTSSDAITVNDHIGFYRDAGTTSANWTVGIGDGATTEQDDDAAVSTAGTYHTFGFVATGVGAVAASVVKFYFDGALIFTTTDVNDFPLLLMCPAFQMDADGANIVMNIDWLRILVTNSTTGGRES